MSGHDQQPQPATGGEQALPRCLVFPDGDDWIVFGPASCLVMRTNEAAARRFAGLPDGHLADAHPSAEQPGAELDELPGQITISPTNQCAQRCVYCYGTPAHHNRAVLDLDFCRAAVELAAQAAASRQEPLHAILHGVGEPTLAWPAFTASVEMVLAAGRRHSVRVFLDLCTGGQLPVGRRQWIAEHFDGIQVSIDGPADIQNRQRPRADGGDALAAPLALAQAARQAGRQVTVKATVTAATVGRLPEIVNFVAAEIGDIRLDLGMMFAPPWVNRQAAAPPDWQEFVAGFGRALDHGAACGVVVRHPSISLETLTARQGRRVARHFCLAAPDVVTAFFDVPREGHNTPQLGAYGWWDRTRQTIVFDRDKRRRLEEEQTLPQCQRCACRAACLGQGGVKGRIPEEIPVLGDECQARLGVLKELLRRAVPRP